MTLLLFVGAGAILTPVFFFFNIPVLEALGAQGELLTLGKNILRGFLLELFFKSLERVWFLL